MVQSGAHLRMVPASAQGLSPSCKKDLRALRGLRSAPGADQLWQLTAGSAQTRRLYGQRRDFSATGEKRQRGEKGVAYALPAPYIRKTI